MAVGAIYLTDASVGAPVLSGTNGALCAVLDWALVQKGWAIEYTATNNRIYRPGAGNRNRLFVAHDSTVSGDARLATVRGCENASAASSASLTNPFPTVAQQANNASTILLSITASAVARPYRLIVTDRFVVMLTNCGTLNTSGWDLFLFGDLYGTESADLYATICHVGASTTATVTTGRGMAACMSHGFVLGKTYSCRSIDGSVLSPSGVLNASTSSTTGANSFCAVVNSFNMRGGYANRIDREKVAVTCNGTTTTTVGATAVHRRGWIPNLWNPVHAGIGAVTSDDVFTDTAYNAGSSFNIAPASGTMACVLETTDTWSAPIG